VDYDIQTGVLSNLAAHNLYNVEVKVAGWGESNDGLVSPKLLSGKLIVLSNSDCENRVEMIQGYKSSLHVKFLCTIARPFLLLHKVSIILLLICTEI
jgi:hypothetical protein